MKTMHTIQHTFDLMSTDTITEMDLLAIISSIQEQEAGGAIMTYTLDDEIVFTIAPKK